MYEEQLRGLGLTDNEIRIYITLLKGGSMNPSEISEKLGLHRGYIYDALERMQEKEVVNYVLKNNKKQFQATRPENLVELLRFKLANFEKIVPSLSAMAETMKEDTSVELHKGKRTYRVILKDIIGTLKKGDEVLLIGVDEEVLLSEIEPIYLRQYFNTIKSKKITERVIMKKGKKKFKNPGVAHRFLNEEYIGNTEQLIYGDSVALSLIGHPNYLIIIKNKEVAETYRKQFELLWKQAKK
jgi:sugar-specific transcriptional regulator TrmB